MNYMKQIAEMLGVELDEEFYLEIVEYGCYFLDDRSNKATFKLSLSGIMTNYHCDGWESADECLVSLLKGAYTIVKKPWKPEECDTVYYVSPNKTIGNVCFDQESGFCVMLVVLGNFFKTEEEITPEVLEETWKRCYGKYFYDEDCHGNKHEHTITSENDNGKYVFSNTGR